MASSGSQSSADRVAMSSLSDTAGRAPTCWITSAAASAALDSNDSGGPLLAATTANATGTGGTGNDGGRGSGPGTGGGVGSGEGTGRGSGNGPGTGGGTGRIYPPYVTNLALLPMPVPSRVRPYTLTAVFEVDERGNAKLLSFNESKDSDYNKKIRAMLQEIRFRPATRADGTPVRDTTTIVAEAKL